jgi:hypothetical protein
MPSGAGSRMCCPCDGTSAQSAGQLHAQSKVQDDNTANISRRMGAPVKSSHFMAVDDGGWLTEHLCAFQNTCAYSIHRFRRLSNETNVSLLESMLCKHGWLGSREILRGRGVNTHMGPFRFVFLGRGVLTTSNIRGFVARSPIALTAASVTGTPQASAKNKRTEAWASILVFNGDLPVTLRK